LILEALAVSAGLGALAFAVRQVRRRASRAQNIHADTDAIANGPRGLRVGDVLLHEDAEYWLAGALHLDEDGLVLRAFHCPGAPLSTWVLQLDARADDLALCTATDAIPEGVVPDSLSVAGQAYTLRRRGRARVTSEGSDIPRGLNHARYNILRGAGGRALVVIDLEDATRLALVGPALDRARIDLLPGGDAGPA
jgi:hypothetical protein